MKLRTTFVLGTCVSIAAAFAPAALAATPEGELSGSNMVAGGSFAFDPPVTDGGTDFVGAGNDLSGTCTDDAGTVTTGGSSFTVACAHFVRQSRRFNTGNPKMRLAYQNPRGAYTVIRVTDNGDGPVDTLAIGQTATLTDATNWVNKGVKGAGHPFSDWAFQTVLAEGDYDVVP